MSARAFVRWTKLRGVLDEIEHFFVAYNQMRGREFKPLQRAGRYQYRNCWSAAWRALQSSKACTGTEAFRRQRFSDLLFADVPSWAGLSKDGIFARASLLDKRLEFSSPKQAMPLLPIRHKLFRSLFNSGLSIASGSE
jgi:hypothetical protein